MESGVLEVVVRDPATLAGAHATMDVILRDAVHSQIQKVGTALMKALENILHDKHLDAIEQGYPFIFQKK